MFHTYMLTVLSLAFGASALAGGVVQEFELDNGLRILVKEDHRAPVVVSQIWYKVGSGYEHNGITGVSHALEHMMFKGTKKYPAGEFSRIVSANGGQENAFTGADYTAYFQKLAKDRLAVSFELEADRMAHCLLLPEEFAKEIEVIKEERRMRTEDKPRSTTYEQFNAVAFRSSPYRNPIIGWMDDLENLTSSDLTAWYERWYAPNNATLVVVGDVDPSAVYELAKTHFGELAPRSVEPVKPRQEPPQRGINRLEVRLPAKESYLLMGYKTPAARGDANEWEPYALEVLAAILDGGDSARFSKNLVRGQNIAASAGAEYTAFSRLPKLFLLDGIPSAGRSVEELEKALRDEIEALKNELVDESELARVRAQLVAKEVFERDSVFYQAMRLGTLITMGLDWRLLDDYVDRLKAVTPQQVQAVARKYLIDDGLTVAVLRPQPIDASLAHNTAGEGASNVY